MGLQALGPGFCQPTGLPRIHASAVTFSFLFIRGKKIFETVFVSPLQKKKQL
jgi:hypothetical protein